MRLGKMEKEEIKVEFEDKELEDWEIITRYVAVWGYQLLAMIFLTTTIILLALPRTVFSATLSITGFILFTGLEIISFKRQRALLQ